MPCDGGFFLIFGCLGVNYRTCGADIRDRISFTRQQAEAFRGRLAAEGVSQSLVLSTCNRCEVFFCGGEDAMEKCRALFVDEFLGDDIAASIDALSGRQALAYLFRIAAGLESMILGEYQILGQVKAAHADSLAGGNAGRELDRILRDAVSCAKRVKTELDIGAVPPSVCRAGMELVDSSVGLSGKRVLIIGSGRTGTLAAKFAHRRGASHIAVCNRSPERALKLQQEVGAEIVDYDSRYEHVSSSDVVVSATASPHMVVKAEYLNLVGPVVFLDLASPRDIDPRVADDPRVTLLSIDGIGMLAAGDHAERARLTARGMEIIDASVASLSNWLCWGT